MPRSRTTLISLYNFIKTSEVKGEELTEYVALIIQRSHPKLEEIVQSFDEETGMFNELKP